MGKRIRLCAAFGLMVLVAAGCSTVGESLGFTPPANPLSKDAKMVRDAAPVPAPVPRELAMELLPAHVVEPGDTLLVQPVELDAPLRLPPDQLVQPDGTIDLGKYGRPLVAGKTLPEVEVIVRDAIKAKEKNAIPMTVRLLSKPGKVFYVLGEVNAPGAFPITGHDTVLSAITQAGGPTRRASEQNVVMSRPTLPEGCRLVYPVCYTNIVQLGDTTTNYQLQPGDRVFVPSKTAMENLFGGRCQKGTGPCVRPQVPCFGGGACAPIGAPVGGVHLGGAPHGRLPLASAPAGGAAPLGRLPAALPPQDGGPVGSSPLGGMLPVPPTGDAPAALPPVVLPPLGGKEPAEAPVVIPPVGLTPSVPPVTLPVELPTGGVTPIPPVAPITPPAPVTPITPPAPPAEPPVAPPVETPSGARPLSPLELPPVP